MLIFILQSTFRYTPQHVFRSWFFWVALIIMVIVILLYHNGYLGRRARPGAASLSGSQGKGMPVSYTNQGRSGYVHYRTPETQFSMYYELGGGSCVVWIDVPSPESWEEVTGLPLSRREETLMEIGAQVVRDQVSRKTGYFKIEGNAILIYA